jgi:acyl-coenzyme A thioesterase PaaI-like protein
MDNRDFKPLTKFAAAGSCFGCGDANPAGLKMAFMTDGRTVVSELSVPDHLCGWNRLVHGGIVATLMDEIMGWTAIQLLQRLILTKSMQIDFLRPVYVGMPLRLEGRIDRHPSDKEAEVTADLYIKDGMQHCSRSRGWFALFTAEAMGRMKIVDQATVEAFARWFGSGPHHPQG